jgi:Protein of unknown function (DUF4239)
MSLSPLVYWAAGFLIISLGGLFISAKAIKIDLAKNGELIIAMLTILGTLVSVLLGLLVSSADEQYRTLEASVNSEATSLNEVFRLSRGLPPAIAVILQDRCIEYCERVIADEWPSMKHGQGSPEVSRIYTLMSDAIVQFRPGNSGEASLQQALLSASSQIDQNRGLRIVASRSTWTRRLLPLILTCAIVVLTCSYLYAGRGSALLHSVLVGLVAITLGTNIGVIFLMTRPFSSEWTIQPEGFELSEKVMRQYKTSPGSTGTPEQSRPKR